MSDPATMLEEYADGLLDEEQCREVEAALARDPALRGEFENVRRFGELLERVHDVRAEERAVQRILTEVAPPHRGLLVLIAAGATAAAAVLAVWLGAFDGGPTDDPNLAEIQREWVVFGRRLGKIAAERREGRVPQTGIGGLEVPPARASGVVFAAALDGLGIALDSDVRGEVVTMVRDHFVKLRKLGSGMKAECRRSDAALTLFRRLRFFAGAGVADAYYDVFRPGLADLRTARRIDPGTMAFVVHDQVSAEASTRYEQAYADAVRKLARRYSRPQVSLVLDRLAPNDRRHFGRDASQDGVGREAVLEIRAGLYKAACDAGVDRLYVDVG